MRHWSYIFLYFLMSGVLRAQTNQSVIGISPFSYASYLEAKYVAEVNEIISTEFVKARRFTIVDRTKLNAVISERELQKSEAFIDSKVIAEGRSLGAQYIVAGHLASLATSNVYSAEAKRYIYSAKILVTLKIIDVETGQVSYAETFGKGAMTEERGFFNFDRCDQPGTGAATDQSIKDALANIACGVSRWINHIFPVMVSIVEVQETHRRHGAQTVLIAAGSTYGLKPNRKLRVVELMKVSVDGHELIRQKEIGVLAIKKVEDTNFSICSVVDGGNEIADKLANKIPLKIVID